MGENLADFLFDVAMVLMFVIALSLFFNLNPLSKKNIELLSASITMDKEIAESVEYNVEYTTVTGADIIGNIINGLETDIIVDNQYIPKDVNYFSEEFNFNIINKSNKYKVTRNINSQGIVESVEYESE